ncbi:MAG TPA: hypothetical protein VF647_18515 [Longimicrobium sp.]
MTAVLFLVVGASVLGSPSGSAQRSPLRSGAATAPAPTSDSALVQAAAVAARVATRAGEAWPGFWPVDQAFILTRYPDAALLVSSTPPPPGYTPLSGEAAPEELRARGYLYLGMPAGLEQSRGFHIAFPVNGRRVTAVPLQPTLFKTLDLLYHESFHLFQIERFARVPGEPRGEFGKPLVDSVHIAPLEFTAKVEVERRILSAALASSRADSLRSLLHLYLATRRARSDGLADVQAVERMMERQEGTARYVGLSAASTATGAGRDTVVAFLRRELARPLEEFSRGPETDARLMRHRLYATGASLGVVLDRLGIPWRDRVQRGEYLDAILARALAFDPRRTRVLSRAALVRFGNADVVGRERAIPR